jgi:predicted O-methyltransferase YrrM
VRPAIEGWTTDAEAAELARLAVGKVVLEVGTYKGFGAVLMAQAGATVWAVDWHRGDPDLGPRDTLCTWWTNVRRHHVEDRVIGLVGRSETVLPMLRPESFDLAFIDGYHEYEAVRADIGLTVPLVKPGGLLVFHDYCLTWRGVVNAVDAFAAKHGLERRVVGSLAIIELKESSRES